MEDLPRRQARGGRADAPDPGEVPGRLANRSRRLDVARHPERTKGTAMRYARPRPWPRPRPLVSGAEPPARGHAATGGLLDARDVAFMAGRWLDEEEGTLSEEIWSAPGGDSMVGMWRLSVGRKVKVFEFLTMVEEEGKVAFRLRHFDRRGVAWEEKDKPARPPARRQGREPRGLRGGREGRHSPADLPAGRRGARRTSRKGRRGAGRLPVPPRSPEAGQERKP